MKGLVSFHAFDPSFTDDVIVPLWNGTRINPEPWLLEGCSLLNRAWRTAAWKQTMLDMLAARPEEVVPETSDRKARMLNPFRKSVAKLFTPVDRNTERFKALVQPGLHLDGRPFFIAEESSSAAIRMVDEYRKARDDEAVDALVREQLIRLDPLLARTIRPIEGPSAPSALVCRANLLDALKSVHALGRAFREGVVWRGSITDGKSPAEAARLLPWFSAAMHARLRPFWDAEDVDGLVSIAQAAGVEPTPVLQSPLPLFQDLKPVDARPMTLGRGLDGPRSTGAWVPPEDVPRLIDWLQAEGAAIIRTAAEHDEGSRVRTLLQKIRECAAYAARQNFGYLEAVDVHPPHWGDPPVL